jgi:ABC-type uncharacterized transport system auxiliary subunit
MRIIERRTGVGVLVMLALLLATGLIGGCTSAKPALLVDQYSLEYPSPALPGAAPLGEVLKVNRFSTTEALRGPMMVVRLKPNVYYADPYHRWRVSPADLATDFLVRDFRNAGLFKAVFTWRDPVDTRFEIEGAVEDFSETKGPEGNKTLLVLRITLLDRSRKDIEKRVMYQKKYASSLPVEGGGADSLASAMSRSMAHLSGQILPDAHTAIQRASGTEASPEKAPAVR